MAETSASSGGSGDGSTTASASTSADDGSTTTSGMSSGGAASTSGEATSTGLDSSDADSTGDSDGSDSSGGDEGQRVLLAVGYGGIRVRSLDDGQSWQDYTQLVDSGGDGMELLRGAAYGDGRFVAAGWRIFSSPDAVEWEEHDNPTGQWLGAVAYGNGMFLGVGGGGLCARSDDGVTWETCTDVTDDGGFEHVRSTLFLDGLFYTADADGDVRTSPDGDVWMFDSNLGTPWIAIDAGQIVAREQSAPAEFPDLRLRGSIERADAGSDEFVSVYDVPNGNSVFQAYRFAFTEGFVPTR